MAGYQKESGKNKTEKQMASNTSRTLEYLRNKGWEAGIVERFNSFAGRRGVRQDLFGVIDIVALGDNKIIGVQSCGSSFSKHDKKILDNPLALRWLRSGGRLLLIGWGKVKLKRGSKAMRWQPRVKEYKIKDFKGVKQSL